MPLPIGGRGELSQKFWSAENYGTGPNFLEKIGPGGPMLSGNFGPGK